MGQSETIDRLNEFAEALGAALMVYQEHVEGIFHAEIAADSLPDRWFAENIKSRGLLWLKVTRLAYMGAEGRAADIKVEKEDGKEEEYNRKRVLQAIATLSLNFSNALAKALKELKEDGEEE
jgi:hypothetical protein